MMSDLGLGLDAQQDLLNMAADYLDLAKLATTLGATLPEDSLRKKIALYSAHDVSTFLGGYLLEYAIHNHGIEIAPIILKRTRGWTFLLSRYLTTICPFPWMKNAN
jgi:hypothetical protein